MSRDIERETNIATIGAFIALGVASAGYDKVLEVAGARGIGCIEVIADASLFAPYMQDAIDKENEAEWAGVFEYEVAEPFGKWFGNYVITKGYTPLTEECLDVATALHEEFFAQVREA